MRWIGIKLLKSYPFYITTKKGQSWSYLSQSVFLKKIDWNGENPYPKGLRDCFLFYHIPMYSINMIFE